MKLKMYLENIFIDQFEIDFMQQETVEERQKYLERNARMLYDKHYRHIQLVNKEPIFFVDVPSRMNND
jgi:hypothetical protein